MKRVFVVVAVVMALTLALGVTAVGAQGPMDGYGSMGSPMGGYMGSPMGGYGGGGFFGPFYRVRFGDTLSEIGLKHGVNFYEIARANGIFNPNVIFAGQKLYIPPARHFPQPFWGGYGQQCPGFGCGYGYTGSYSAGYASWSSGSCGTWGGYPCGGFYQMPYGGGMFPYGGGYGAHQLDGQYPTLDAKF